MGGVWSRDIVRVTIGCFPLWLLRLLSVVLIVLLSSSLSDLVYVDVLVSSHGGIVSVPMHMCVNY